MSLNLASRPFVNRRPIQRIGVFLWVVAGLLAVVNGVLYMDYFRGSGRAARERFLVLEGEIRSEKGRIETKQAELSRYDLAGQSEEVDFLNDRIAERAFGWSRLFDRLAYVLPRQVRMTNVTPRSLRGRKESTREEVSLNLQGLAKTGDALYQLVDAFYSHPAFEEPRLTNEFLRDGTITFNLGVTYLPAAPDPEPVEEEGIEEVEPASREMTEQEQREESET